MKVEKSKFLENARPLLQQLIGDLRKEYPYVSVLGNDCRSRSFRMARSGMAVSAGGLYTERGFVLRVMDEKGFGEYSFNHLSTKALAGIEERIRKNLIPLLDCLPETIDFMKREVPEDLPRELEGAGDYELHPDELGEKEILERLQAVRRSGMETDERVIDCAARLEYQEIHKLFLSANRSLEQDLLWTDGSIVAMARRGQEIKTQYQPFSLLGGAELLDQMKDAAPEVARVAVELLESEPLVPGTYECVCTPDVTGMIVHEAFGHGVEMDMFVKDRALAADYIGKYVASPLVTMHDGAAVARQTGSYFFDDEGVEACDTVIIEKGILKRGISDSLSASSLGTVPTGNGRRQDYSRKAYTRMTNTWFEGGTDSVEDMIASVKDGLLLESPSSGMEDPKNWGIQAMVSFGREIKDGKLTGRIFSPIVLSGFVPDLLKSISMMSPNAELSGSGMCGKGYKEWVKVSCGGPYIKAMIRLG